MSLFGEYKYYPAARNLAMSLEAGSDNLAQAALQALKAMYPEGRARFALTSLRSKESAAKYWVRFVEERSGENRTEECHLVAGE